MKLKKILMSCGVLTAHLIFVSDSASSSTVPSITPSTNCPTSILMSLQIPSEMLPATKNLHDTVVSYPIRGVFEDGTVQQGITNRSNKVMPPKKTQPILARGNFSVLPPKAGEFAGYPGGATLFAGYSDVAAKFDTMIALFGSNSDLVTFFRKVHINMLHELYHYLMSIYVNFNLQHTGISQSADGALHVNIPAFLKDENEYAANKKTLIINHLINIIESQFNSSIRTYVPNLPQVYASYLGKTLIQNDYSLDLSKFLDTQTDPKLIAYKKLFLQGLATYLDFYQTYTSYLNKPHPAKRQHFTAFVDIAENINQYLYADAQAGDDKAAIAVSKMNPPLFSFTYDDIRALKMIPYLAKTLPKQSKKIMWPTQIVQAANEGLVLKQQCAAPHPLAYFRTDEGIVVKNTTNDPTIKLYMCVRTGQNLFEEQLIPEPDWLSSWSGIEKIMRACFGDFSALLGMNILDPCMETLVQLAVIAQKGQDPNSFSTRSVACMNMLSTLRQGSTTASSSPTTGVNLPGVSVPGTSLPGVSLPGVSSNYLQQSGG